MSKARLFGSNNSNWKGGKTTVFCSYCNKEFSKSPSLVKDKNYCCRQCCWNSKIKPIKLKAIKPKAPRCLPYKICKTCQEPFYASPSVKKIYCSSQCYFSAKGKPVELICHNCEKSFLRLPFKASRYEKKFCSADCKNEHMRTLVGKESRTGKPKLQRVCEFCKTIFEITPARASRNRFCSKACLNTWNAHNQQKNGTSIEKVVKSLLISLDIPFSEQVPIGHFICDFLVPISNTPGLVIEADGTFWHSLPKTIERDSRKNKLFLSLGYTILRLPEAKINTDLEWCKQQIIAIYQPPVKSSNGTRHEMVGTLVQGVLFPY